MINRVVLVFLVCSALSAPARDGAGGAEPRRRVRRFNSALPEPETPAPRKATPEEVLRWTLEMVHGSSLDVHAIAESLAQYEGWSVERVRNAYLETALDKHEEPRARNGAIQFFCKLSETADLVAAQSLLSNEEDFVRTAVMASVFNSLEDGPARLAFAKRCLESHSEGEHCKEVARVVSGRMAAFLEYGKPSERDKNEFVGFYRVIAEQAMTAAAALSADSFLARFDPAWQTNETRKVLLEKWKDDPSLSEFARENMRKELAAFADRSDLLDAVSADSSDEEETSPVSADSPSPAPAEDGAETGEAPSEAPRPSEPEMTAAREARPDSRAGWKTFVFGAAVLVLLLVLSKNVYGFQKMSRHD